MSGTRVGGTVGLEAMSEAAAKKSLLYIVTLDAMKAFDVVSHPIFLRKYSQTKSLEKPLHSLKTSTVRPEKPSYGRATYQNNTQFNRG